MFNRTLQVKMVKSQKEEVQKHEPTELQFEKKVAVISGYSWDVLKKAGGVVLAYVALDTIRQVLVAKASK
jgi:hypothetical protein